ncbi:MAG: glycoside hydrolase domain-containing protein [Planctomycetota bacterium]|jgi:hypothetical protein
MSAKRRAFGSSWTWIVCAAACATSVAAAGEKTPRPRLVVPRLERAPTVDGVLAPGEWDRAAAVTGFIGATGKFGGRMVPYESRIWLGHDGTRLYLGVRVALAPGAKPSMKYRRRDEPVYMDSHQVEVWLTPPPRGPLTAYQFIGNAYGAVFDVKQVPSLGSVTATWNGNWKLENHYEEGKYWSAEIAVPFSDFDDRPVSAAEPWGGMVGVAWPQRSWPFTSGWYKNVDTHALMTMSDGGTCARVEDLSSLFDNELAPVFTVVNAGAAGKFRVSLRVGNVRLTKTVVVGAGEICRVGFDPRPLPPAAPKQKRTLHVKVTGPRGKTLIEGAWLFTPVAAGARAQKPAKKKPWRLSTRVSFAPLAMGMKLWADLLDCPGREKLETVRFTVRGAGGGDKVLERNVTKFAYDSAEALVRLPKDLAFGKYEVRTRFLDGGGRAFAERTDGFEHKDHRKQFVWLGSDSYGERFTVSPPFTPIRVRRRTFEVVGRRIEMRGALPEQITSKGEELLAAPVNLVAVVQGRKVPARVTRRLTLGKRDDARAEFTGSYEFAGLDIDLSGYIDFDGMIFYELAAKPAPRSPDSPPLLTGGAGVIQRLYLPIPVKNERARYYHSTAGGWSGAFGIIEDEGDGRLWSSEGFADFVPYVGLSDDERGIQWFADNDHDWALGDDAPCAEIVRRRGVTELRVNLVRASGPPWALGEGFERAFSAKFGLIAFPVKPMPRGWRNANLDFGRHGENPISFFFGPGHGGCPVDPHDSAKLCKILNVDTKGRNPDEVLALAPPGSLAKPSTDPAYKEYLTKTFGHKFRETVHGNQLAAKRLAADPGSVRRCWFFNAKMYFEGNRSPAFRAFFPGEWQLDPPSGWFHLTPTESYQDFFSFHMGVWHKHWSMPGLYFDEVYLAPDRNVFNGNGKVMPDGTVRPSVPLMRQRRFMRRMRQLYVDNDRTPFIWVHTSNYMAPHAISAVDVAMFGEDKAPTPFSDVMDTISPVLMRTIGRSQKFGFVPVWMNQAGRGDGSGPRASFFTRQCYGWCWMHDTSPEYHTSTRGRPLVEVRHAWGIEERDVEFVPYWDHGGALKTSAPAFLVSAWTRPGGKALLHVMNMNRADGRDSVTVMLDAAALGLGARVKVYDVERGEMLGGWAADMREIDRLMAEDPAANAARVKEINRRHKDVGRRVGYDPARWKLVGEGAWFDVTVPPRDFVTLVVE